ncbi:MAG: sigma-70 family RNA polymerase sigma factor [Clostridia bacterium]|nr:sigma-70 family RNA polymerase sigma factor [Clostridia bacterium]
MRPALREMLNFYLSIIETPEEKNKFSVLYNKWKKPMYHTAYHILEDHELCEDVMQEVFFYIAKNIHKIDDPESAATGRYLILTTITNAKKLQGKWRESFLEDEQTDLIDNETVESAYFDRFDKEMVLAKLREIPEGYRMPLLLKYGEGRSSAEIGEIMGLKDFTVRKRIERAKKMLAEILKNEL